MHGFLASGDSVVELQLLNDVLPYLRVSSVQGDGGRYGVVEAPV